MKKYALIIDEKNKLCNVGLGTNEKFYQSQGFTLQDVEQAYNGQWYIAGFAPKRPIDELKKLKRTEINTARDTEEQGGFEYLGKFFDSDSISCLRISCASQSMSLAPEETTIIWTCQDNSTIELNKEQLAGLVTALANHSNKCHQKANSLKTAIDAAISEEELSQIHW